LLLLLLLMLLPLLLLLLPLRGALPALLLRGGHLVQV
jgi:hypothetical protein